VDGVSVGFAMLGKLSSSKVWTGINGGTVGLSYLSWLDDKKSSINGGLVFSGQ
jgi:hypothetical protein